MIASVVDAEEERLVSRILCRGRRILANECGATSIEYALLAALVAVAIVLSATTIGTQLDRTFLDVSEKFPDAP